MSRKSFDKEIMGKTCGFKRWDFTSRDTANWTKWERWDKIKEGCQTSGILQDQCEDTERRETSIKSRRVASGETKPANTLILDFEPLE